MHVPIDPIVLSQWRDALGKPWSLERYEDPVSPLLVMIDVLPALPPDTPTYGLRVLDMLVKDVGSTRLMFPDLTPTWVRDLCGSTLDFERQIVDVEAWFMYLTVDRGWVAAHTTQRVAGAHFDGMQSPATYPSPHLPCHAYLASDVAPTVYHDQSFDFNGCDPLHDDLFKCAQRRVDSSHNITMPPSSLALASSFNVHSAGRSEAAGWRTFVRIEFSQKRFDRDINTRNPRFSYEGWEFRPRPIPTHLR